MTKQTILLVENIFIVLGYLYILQLKAENTSLKSELTTLQKDHQSLHQQLNDIQKRLNK